MRLKPITSALANAGMLALLSASGSAQAGAMASAMVNMTDFTVQKATSDTGAGLAQVSAGDLVNLQFTSTMDYSANLNGSIKTVIDGVDLVGTEGIDMTPICVGPACGAPLTTNNAFAQKPAADANGNNTAVVGNYAAADQVELGSPVAGLAPYTLDAAHVGNSAYVGIADGSGSASSTSNNNLNATWSFTTGFAGFMAFDFMVDAYIQAALGPLEGVGTTATASYNVSFSLTCSGFNIADDTTFCFDSVPVPAVSWEPDLFPSPLGQGRTTISLLGPNQAGTEDLEDTGGAIHMNSVDALGFWIPVNIGKELVLSARINTEADVVRAAIPEPGVLALLGLGLFGLAAGLRKKVA